MTKYFPSARKKYVKAMFLASTIALDRRKYPPQDSKVIKITFFLGPTRLVEAADESPCTGVPERL